MIKTFFLRDAAILERCIAFLRTLVGGDTVFCVTIVPADRKRTLEQNAYFHKQLRTLSDEAWINGRQGTVADWKAYLLTLFGYVETHTDLRTGLQQVTPVSTTTLRVKDFTDLIERTHRYAAEAHGLELMK